MTTKEHNAELRELLSEVRQIRERLDELSDSAKKITEAIHGVLSETGPGFSEDAYRVLHEDL